MSDLIVRIDRDLCDGCGECITVCSEDVLAMQDGKVSLIAGDLCDGFGRCFPACPTGALTLEARFHACRDQA